MAENSFKSLTLCADAGFVRTGSTDCPSRRSHASRHRSTHAATPPKRQPPRPAEASGRGYELRPSGHATNMARPAAQAVCKPLTSSLLSQGQRPWPTAPKRLSSRVAMNPTTTTTAAASAEGINPKATITRVINRLPRALAAVPSKLTAPSVPGGTGRKLVISSVVRPHRFPISLPKVSANLAAKLAAKPIRSPWVGPGAPRSRGPTPVRSTPTPTHFPALDDHRALLPDRDPACAQNPAW